MIKNLIKLHKWATPSYVKNIVNHGAGFIDLQLEDGCFQITPSMDAPLKVEVGDFCVYENKNKMITRINGKKIFFGKTKIHYDRCVLWVPGYGELCVFSNDGKNFTRGYFINYNLNGRYVSDEGVVYTRCYPVTEPFVGNKGIFQNKDQLFCQVGVLKEIKNSKYVVDIEGKKQIFELFKPYLEE